MNQRTFAYLIVRDPRATLDFAQAVFDAEIVYEAEYDGVLRHAQFKVQGVEIMIGPSSDEYPPASTMMYVYVDDVDATFVRAKEHATEVEMVPTDHDYGDRSAGVQDSNGIKWHFATCHD